MLTAVSVQLPAAPSLPSDPLACRDELERAKAVRETSAGVLDVTERAVKGCTSMSMLTSADCGRTTSRLRTAPA